VATVSNARPSATARQHREQAGAAPADVPAPAAERRAPGRLALTLVAEVKRRRVPALKRTLEAMGADPANNPTVPFAALPRTHFARFVVLDATTGPDGERIEAQLLYMADVDEPPGGGSTLERCLAELVEVGGAGLDRILGACVGYPPAGRITPSLRMAFLLAHSVKAAVSYVNTVGRSVGQIRQEDQLRLAIRAFLDRRGAEFVDLPPQDVRRLIQDFAGSRPELSWALAPPPSPSLTDRVRDAAELVALPVGLLALSPVLVPALPLFALALRRQEARDPAPHVVPSRELVLALAENEDQILQNQFNAVGSDGVGFVKPGIVRRITAGVVLRGADFAVRHVFNHANLAGVKTIHSARWVFLDEQRRRLIFASNYDGSLEAYNDDFVDKVWWGLNAVFSNGTGFPSTQWLFFGGSKQEQQFKDYLRGRQVPSQVWYSAYPDLTALNIENNARIRAGLRGEASGKEAQAWLLRI
jgi:hypothetical protein